MDSARLPAILESALDTFAQLGFAKSSMDTLAANARISRPGLYLYFSSKEDLLRAAVEYALDRDVTQAEGVLARGDAAPLRSRLVDALDLWAGRYVGSLGADLEGLLARDASLLGNLPQRYSDRFAAAITHSLTDCDEPAVRALSSTSRDAAVLREVILALSVGTKQRSTTRRQFRSRLTAGLTMIIG